MKKFILASGSPRRRELLTEAGYRFEIVSPDVDEENFLQPDMDPQQAAEALADLKAREVAGRITEPAVVLGADTLVSDGSRILGKARDADHARQMLHALSRTPHCVITGVSVIETDSGRVLVESSVSRVTMRPMTEEQIEGYIASGAWQDKAGAYAVQEGADQFVIAIDGSYTNVVGLPMELVRILLKQMDIFPVKGSDES